MPLVEPPAAGPNGPRRLRAWPPACSRRALLAGVAGLCGAGAAGALGGLGAGCAADEEGTPRGVATPCGAGALCLDLAAPANRALAVVGGAVLIDAGGAPLLVARASATRVIALDARCTHVGCEVAYDAAGRRLVCPCHGSTFTEAGEVVTGPAADPLRAYRATLAAGVVTLTP